MNLSARVTTFGAATSLDHRGRRRRVMSPDDVAGSEPIPLESVRMVNRFPADRAAPRPVTGALSSALAVLDITTLLDAGLARAVPSAPPPAQAVDTGPDDGTPSIDQLLAGVLAGPQPTRQ